MRAGILLDRHIQQGALSLDAQPEGFRIADPCPERRTEKKPEPGCYTDAVVLPGFHHYQNSADDRRRDSVSDRVEDYRVIGFLLKPLRVLIENLWVVAHGRYSNPCVAVTL